MNRTSRDSRRLYPDPVGALRAVGPLSVYWLEVNGTTPARETYEKRAKKPQVLAALTAIDYLLAGRVPVPRTKMESFTKNGIKLYEIKAPPTGKQIFRLLAYRESDWNMFVAYANIKRSQSLPEDWKTVAASRIRDALKEGRPL
jgi:hypothetical protein